MKEQFYLMLPSIYLLVIVMLVMVGMLIKSLFSGGKQKSNVKNSNYNRNKCDNRGINSNISN